MPFAESTPLKQNLHNPSTLLSLLRHDSSTPKKPKSSSSKPNNFLKLFKTFPLLSSGCKVAAMLVAAGGGGVSKTKKAMIADHATIGTLFGHRRGRITLAIQADPHSPPYFVVELPIHSSSFNKEMMSCDVVRIAFETQTKTHRKSLTDEVAWAVYCNGRKVGYAIRRAQLSDDEARVLQTLRGVSMGAGVLPDHHHHHHHHGIDQNEQITYLRARFERVVGSKDSQALYMINPDNADAPELSIFFLRLR